LFCRRSHRLCRRQIARRTLGCEPRFSRLSRRTRACRGALIRRQTRQNAKYHDMNWPNSQQLLAKNSKLIPGGLGALNRKADPIIAFRRAKGSHLWDVEGREYIDYHAGFAPYILGHNDDYLTSAVNASMREELSN